MRNPWRARLVGHFYRLFDRRQAEGDRGLDAVAVAAQQAVEGQAGGQAQQVVEGDVKGAAGRRRAFGERGQLGQGELGVQRVQVEGAVGAGAADAGDLLQRLAGEGRVKGGAAPGHLSLAGLDADEHGRHAIHRRRGSEASGRAGAIQARQGQPRRA